MIEMETRQHIAALAPEHISDLSESQIRAYTQAIIADLKGLFYLFTFHTVPSIAEQGRG